MPLSIAKGPFAGRARAVGLTLAPVVALALALATATMARSRRRGGPNGQRAGVGDLDTSVAHAFRHGRRGVSLGPGTGRARTAPRALRARHRSPGPPVDRPDDGGEPIESWAVRAFAAWRVGRKGLDDGVAVFILAADRKVRIEVGYGVEDRLPDAVAARIIGDQMIPRLRAGDQDGAARAGVSGVLEAVGGETGAPREAVPAPAPRPRSSWAG